MNGRAADVEALAGAIHDALPQTQCTRCGYADCQAYAWAIARDEAAINQCPPGGEEGVRRLAAVTGRSAAPLNPANGTESVRKLAQIDEAWCIGCTLCLQACPVDCILGAAKLMHVIAPKQCTGCELCLPACPVDCIKMVPTADGATGWQAWSADQAHQALERYEWHKARHARESAARATDICQTAGTAAGPEPVKRAVPSKASVIQAALARARAARGR